MLGFSLVAEGRGCSLLVVLSFSLQWLLLLWSTGSRALGLQWLQLPGSRAQALELWHTGLAAPRHEGSARIRDGTCVSCIGWRILHHRAHQGSSGCFSQSYRFPAPDAEGRTLAGPSAFPGALPQAQASSALSSGAEIQYTSRSSPDHR